MAKLTQEDINKQRELNKLAGEDPTRGLDIYKFDHLVRDNVESTRGIEDLILALYNHLPALSELKGNDDLYKHWRHKIGFADDLDYSNIEFSLVESALGIVESVIAGDVDFSDPNEQNHLQKTSKDLKTIYDRFVWA